MTCSKSPSGIHCYHNLHANSSGCFHVGPCPFRCCFCGEMMEAAHGPFIPTPFTPSPWMNPSIQIQGWSCSLCGAWVPMGTAHSCMRSSGTTSTVPKSVEYRLNYDEGESARLRVETERFWRGDGWQP